MSSLSLVISQELYSLGYCSAQSAACTTVTPELVTTREAILTGDAAAMFSPPKLSVDRPPLSMALRTAALMALELSVAPETASTSRLCAS